MAQNRKAKLHAIKTNAEEIEAQIRQHRRKVLKRGLIFAGILIVLIAGLIIYFSLKQYTDYEVLETTERDDTAATKFEEYEKGLLKYSNDGIFYTDLENNLIWNQTYEMLNPTLDICEDYIAVADLNGTAIYIMNNNSPQGEVITSQPVYDFCVAAQGTIAVLLKGESSYTLKIYDRTGAELGTGEIYAKNSGYPLAMAITPDAKKVAVSYLTVKDGQVSTNIKFYNFGSVGQNEQDHIVGDFSYDSVVIPELTFPSNDTLWAFGDSQIQIYTGSQKPVLENTLDLEGEVKSVFYNDSHFGLVYNNEDKDNSRRFVVYDEKCTQTLSKDFIMDYDKISFLTNDEICIRNENECQIYSRFGVKKFEYAFDVSIYNVIPRYFGIYYTLILDGSTEKVKLR